MNILEIMKKFGSKLTSKWSTRKLNIISNDLKVHHGFLYPPFLLGETDFRRNVSSLGKGNFFSAWAVTV